MGNGFASVKSEKEKSRAKRPKLTPIKEIQSNLSSYFSDIKDPRVKRTKKHLLTDILVIAILGPPGRSKSFTLSNSLGREAMFNIRAN